MPARQDKVVTSSWAAKVLAIAGQDLPKLDHPWTKGDVRALRDSKPDWLTEARRRYAARVREANEARAARLDIALARLGYDAADLGTLDQAVLYIDGAQTHLMTVTGCSEADAELAAWRRWPKSMAAEQSHADRGFW